MRGLIVIGAVVALLLLFRKSGSAQNWTATPAAGGSQLPPDLQPLQPLLGGPYDLPDVTEGTSLPDPAAANYGGGSLSEGLGVGYNMSDVTAANFLGDPKAGLTFDPNTYVYTGEQPLAPARPNGG